METDKKSLIQHLFEKNDLRQVEDELLKDYLTRYPYFAHLFWINAIKNKTDKGALKKAGLHTFYPVLLQACVDRGIFGDAIDGMSENHNPADVNKSKETDAVTSNESPDTIESTETESEEKITQVEEETSDRDTDEHKPKMEVLQSIQEVEHSKIEEEEVTESAEDDIEEKNTKAETPISPIQPLYTEDYFAYTQTKLPDKIEDDKPPTMEQVKSFTGWLKMMKNTAADSNKEAAFKEVDDNESEDWEEDGASDESLHNEEIVTESMAKIWADNGDYVKAKDIYEKLILLNPEKKTYFATKINALKER